MVRTRERVERFLLHRSIEPCAIDRAKESISLSAHGLEALRHGQGPAPAPEPFTVTGRMLTPSDTVTVVETKAADAAARLIETTLPVRVAMTLGLADVGAP